jgi:hypothetical protein
MANPPPDLRVTIDPLGIFSDPLEIVFTLQKLTSDQFNALNYNKIM